MACILSAIVVSVERGQKKTVPKGTVKNLSETVFWLLGLSHYVQLKGVPRDVNPRTFRGNERFQNNEQHHSIYGMLHFFAPYGAVWRCFI